MSLNLVGTVHGGFNVLCKLPSKNKKAYWQVVCISCNKQYSLSSDVIKKNIGGCVFCARKNVAKGSDSIYYKGGKYVTARFLSNVKHGARKRNITCEITIDELDKLWEAQDGKCSYTGRELTLSGEECTASLDRIDSNEGYYLGNVQFVHKTVNVMKWALPEEEFLGFIEEIYGYRIHQKQLSIL